MTCYTYIDHTFVQDFDKGLLFNMSIANSLDFELYEPISQQYLVALPISNTQGM